MDHKTIIRDIKKRIFYPVYFLAGEEPFYIDKISNILMEYVLDDTQKEFNQSILYGKETHLDEVLSTAKRYPMMAEHHLVIVKEAQHLKKEITNKNSKLLSYLENPVKSTILVFCYKDKKPRMNTKVGKMIKSNAVFFESPKIYEYKIPQWIEEYIQETELKADPKVCTLLAEHLGNDLQRIANEIDKLQIILSKGEDITPEIIEKNVGISKEYNIFELQNAISYKNNKKAQMIVDHFSKNPNEHAFPRYVSIFYSYLTRLLLYKELANKKDRKELAAELKIHPFFLKEYSAASNNHSKKKVTKLISELKNYDLKSKGVNNNSSTDGELMKEYVQKFLE
ncbi:MAG: DNA polymerase III subunit delta [Flavobacteriales bacterium]